VIGKGVDFVIKCEPAKLEAMTEFVKKMHTDSGLLPLIPDGISMADAEEKILKYLAESGVVEGKSPIAGNSVNFDRGFIERDMTNFAKMLHYRTIDVSSIKELARRWYPKVYFKSPTKTGNHRALGDIKDSIAELAHYRANLFAITPEN
jgi:oligoribonuclease